MLTLPSVILFGIAFCVLLTMGIPLGCMAWIRRQPLIEPPRWPGISLLKPLAGLDDALEENLESHVMLDYPGPWEILLGVRSEQDAAYPLARAFANKHPERVRLILQQGEPGYNPKVNQLITLSREAQYEFFSLTDSNVRVPRTFLREVGALLSRPEVGVATNLIAGVGEQNVGAVLDNMTVMVQSTPFIAMGAVLFKLGDLTGKAMALRREVLEEVGGWRSLRKVLAEDQLLGRALKRRGYRVAFCPSPIENVQIHKSLGYFFQRQTRWLIIRYRNLFPAVLLEPVTLPVVLGGLAVFCSAEERLAWGLCLAVVVLDLFIAQACAWLLRGHGFKVWHLMMVPLREIVFLAAWARAATLDTVEWRGHVFYVLHGTRLASAEARARALRRMKRR